MLKIVASGCRVLTPGQRPQEIQISRPETVPMHSSLRPVHSSYSMRRAVILNGCRVEKNGEVFVRYGKPSAWAEVEAVRCAESLVDDSRRR